LQFWPTSLIKKAGQKVLSTFSNSWLSHSKKEGKGDLTERNLLESKLLVEKQPGVKDIEVSNTFLESYLDPSGNPKPPSKPLLTGSTEPEMDDQWFKTNDMNGLLTWGILLSRKWTGYCPKSHKDQSYHHTEIDIKLGKAREWVNLFMDKVEENAQTFGIEKAVSDVVENLELYTQAIETARKQLAIAKPETILDLLFDQIVQKNISKIASKSTIHQANKLLEIIREDLLNMQEPFLQQEIGIQSQCQSDMSAHGKTEFNINFFQQEICAMKPTHQLVDNTTLLGNDYNKNYNIIPNDIDHVDRYRKCGSL
ncbi:hypothetical protein, partial [Cardinium endosymbiont of Bemisia tabaci]